MYYYKVKIEEMLSKYNILKDVKCDLSINQIEMLDKFYNFLIKENNEYNLTSITEFSDVLHKHFYDSLIFTSQINIENKKVIDVGTGCGVPGIILKICFPSIELFLVESNAKKTTFLSKVTKELDLQNVHIINSRIEDFSKENKEQYDIVVSRAMARLNILFELCSQLPKINGTFIALKARKYKDELEELDGNENELGFKHIKSQIFENDILGVRANIFYEKVARTSNKYPRNYSMIKKKPIGNFKIISKNKNI